MILVTGSNGMLAKDLLSLLGAKGKGLSHAEMDITDLLSVQQVLTNIKPRVVINCAALADVDRCETDAEAAMQVNGEGVAFLAMISAEIGAKLVQVSSDYLFDGTKGSPYLEDDLPKPINIYGESKLAGELNADVNPNNLVVRAQWLYGLHGKNFLETMLLLGKEKKELTVVDDQIGAPTWTMDLAKGIISLIDHDCTGVYHCANGGSVSWNGFAKAIFEEANMDVTVLPISTAELDRPAKRPLDTILDCSKLAKDTGFIAPHWRESLRTYLALRSKKNVH